ncbi:hypothetical protein KSS87_000035 [Heliosperma pusillum]|nr:hypothetical protein KSS87_000035 [Heliosperma pusillum]
MLDEAIEYLKQLQLQVQMLTMRNGTSLHPFCPPSVGQLMNPPTIGQLVDEVNNSRGISSFTPHQEGSMQPMQAMYNFDSKPGSSHMPRMSENHNPGPSLVLEPSMIYRPFSASIPSKVLCKDPGMPQLQLDMSRCGQSSSSGVST